MGLLAVAIAAAAIALVAHWGGLLDRPEHDTVDVRFDLREADPPEGIAVVGIDERTFSELGTTWPFSRRLHARAVRRLDEAGVRLIVYDVQFTEPSPDPGADVALYEALERAGGAVLATGESDAAGRTAVLGGDENLAAIDAEAGATNLPADSGGVVRRYARAAGKLRSLPVVAAERLGRATSPSMFSDHGAYIDFHGPPGTFPTFSFSDLVEGRVPAARLRGQVVVVGASAPTLQDVHATSTSGDRRMSGPEIQANAISTALRGNPLRPAPDWVTVLSVLMLALVAPLAGLARRPWLVAAAMPVALVALAAGAVGAFGAGTVVAVVAPALALGIGVLGSLVVSYAAEAEERRRVAMLSDRLRSEVRERTRELRETQLEVVQRLAQAAESRDGSTGEHIERLGHLAERLALEIGLGADRAELIRHATTMHDVGKIGIPDRILLKRGALDEEERRVMQTHAGVGAQILAGSRSSLLRLAEQIARTHHERWDGTGYPAGLQGLEIPLEGRICAVCDVFDALVSARPYKRAWPLDEALEEIAAQRARHLDPALVDAFLAMAARDRAVFEELAAAAGRAPGEQPADFVLRAVPSDAPRSPSLPDRTSSTA